jgi:predicted alpha/beta hydrolase
MEPIENVKHYVSNNDGWELALRRRFVAGGVRKNRRPVAIVPGYGMNSRIFGYHPHSPPLEEYIASRGFEVWSMDLRQQGNSRRTGSARRPRNRRFGLRELAIIDLRAALDYIASHTAADAASGTVDCLGCSLGGSIIFAYFALSSRPRVGTLVALGAPLRWREVHPFIRVAFGSPFVMGHLPFHKSREIAGFLLPKVTKIPGLIDFYIHGNHSDLRYTKELVETVEDPVPSVNREISIWIKTKDLFIEGVNVTEGMRSFSNPVCALVANADGIVPPATATSVLDVVQSKIRDTITVGNRELRFAHADLYVSNHATEMVFKPVADWLEGTYKR